MAHTPLQTTLQEMHDANLHHDKKKWQEVVQHLHAPAIKEVLTADGFEQEKRQALEDILEAIFDRLNQDQQLKKSFGVIEIASFFDSEKYESSLLLLEECIKLLPDQVIEGETESIVMLDLTYRKNIFVNPTEESLHSLITTIQQRIPFTDEQTLLRYILAVLPQTSVGRGVSQSSNSARITEDNTGLYEKLCKLGLIIPAQAELAKEEWRYLDFDCLAGSGRGGDSQKRKLVVDLIAGMIDRIDSNKKTQQARRVNAINELPEGKLMLDESVVRDFFTTFEPQGYTYVRQIREFLEKHKIGLENFKYFLQEVANAGLIQELDFGEHGDFISFSVSDYRHEEDKELRLTQREENITAFIDAYLGNKQEKDYPSAMPIHTAGDDVDRMNALTISDAALILEYIRKNIAVETLGLQCLLSDYRFLAWHLSKVQQMVLGCYESNEYNNDNFVWDVSAFPDKYYRTCIRDLSLTFNEIDSSFEQQKAIIFRKFIAPLLRIRNRQRDVFFGMNEKGFKTIGSVHSLYNILQGHQEATPEEKRSWRSGGVVFEGDEELIDKVSLDKADHALVASLQELGYDQIEAILWYIKLWHLNPAYNLSNDKRITSVQGFDRQRLEAQLLDLQTQIGVSIWQQEKNYEGHRNLLQQGFDGYRLTMTPEMYVQDVLLRETYKDITRDVQEERTYYITRSLALQAIEHQLENPNRDFDFYIDCEEEGDPRLIVVKKKVFESLSNKDSYILVTDIQQIKDTVVKNTADTTQGRSGAREVVVDDSVVVAPTSPVVANPDVVVLSEQEKNDAIDTTVLQHLTKGVASFAELLAVVVAQTGLQDIDEQGLRVRLAYLQKAGFVAHPQTVPAGRTEPREQLYVLTVLGRLKNNTVVDSSKPVIVDPSSPVLQKTVPDAIDQSRITMPAGLESKIVQEKAYRNDKLAASGMPEKTKQSFGAGLELLVNDEVLLKAKDEKPKTDYDIFLTFEGEEPQAFYRQGTTVVIINNETPLYYTLGLSDVTTATKETILLRKKRERLMEEKKQLDTLAQNPETVAMLLLLGSAFAQLRSAEKEKKGGFSKRTLVTHIDPKAKSPLYGFLLAIDNNSGFAMKELLLSILVVRSLCVDMLKRIIQRTETNPDIADLEPVLTPLLQNKEMRTLWQEAKGLTVVVNETNVLQQTNTGTLGEDPNAGGESTEVVGESFDKLLGMTPEHAATLRALGITSYTLLQATTAELLQQYFPDVWAATMRPVQAAIVNDLVQLNNFKSHAIRAGFITHIASLEPEKTMLALQGVCQKKLDTEHPVTARQIIVWFIAQELTLRDDDPLLLAVGTSLDTDKDRLSAQFMEIGNSSRPVMQVNKVLLTHIDTLTKENKDHTPVLTRKVRPDNNPLDAEYVLWSKESTEVQQESFGSIFGMRPECATVLHEAGILTYHDLMNSNPLALEKLFPDALMVTLWPAQAKAVIQNDTVRLEELKLLAVREGLKQAVVDSNHNSMHDWITTTCTTYMEENQEMSFRDIVAYMLIQRFALDREDHAFIVASLHDIDNDDAWFESTSYDYRISSTQPAQVNEYLLVSINGCCGSMDYDPLLCISRERYNARYRRKGGKSVEDEAVEPPPVIEELIVTERVDLSQASDLDIIAYLILRIPGSSEDPIGVMDVRNETKGTGLDLQKFMTLIKQLCTISPNTNNKNNPFIRLK